MIPLRNENPTEIQIAYKSHADPAKLHYSNGSTVFPPKGQCLVVGFYFHNHDRTLPRSILIDLIRKNVGIVYVCDEMPNKPIIDDHIVYVVTQFRWFTQHIFTDISFFKGILYNKGGEKYAKLLARNSKFSIPIISRAKELTIESIKQDVVSHSKDVIIETYDGLGDVIMSLPSAQTLHSLGYKVNYLTYPHFNEIFNNLKFINKVYNVKETVSTTNFAKYVSLTSKLSNYSYAFNQQNRIYSSAFFCDLAPKQLVTNVPTLVTNPEEKKWARELLKGYKHTVGIGWRANGFARSYPKEYTTKLVNLASFQGYTPVILSADNTQFKGAINLGGKTSIRQLFALIEALDYIVTVDTGTLHVAGAFGTPTIALIGPIDASWRCSTYKNCYPLKPNIPCYPCFPGGTYVTTQQGTRLIRDIKVGEEVVTHRGRLQKVDHKYQRYYDGPLYRVSVEGLNKPIFCTPEYPFRVLCKDHVVKWKQAKRLKKEDYLLRPKINIKTNTKKIDLKDYNYPFLTEVTNNSIKKYSPISLNNSRISLINRYINVNEDLASLLGFYLAEGSINRSCTTFTFSSLELDYIKEVESLSKRIFGVDSTTFTNPKDHTTAVNISSDVVSFFMAALGGKNSKLKKRKRIPQEIFDSSKKTQLSLLDSFIKGDGVKTYKYSFVIDIHEKKLSLGLYHLCLLNNLPCSFKVHKPSKSKSPFRGQYRTASYVLSISKKALSYIKGIESDNFYHFFGDYKVIKTSIMPYKGQVYNLEVAQDNSYCVMGYAAHNCADRQWVASKDQKCRQIESYCLKQHTPARVLRALNRIARRKKWKLKDLRLWRK